MPQTIIEQFKPKADHVMSICQQLVPAPLTLNVSEMFSETIQGEGYWIGYPASFLRLQGCTLDCVWCDTAEVWRAGNPFTFAELFYLLEKHQAIESFRDGQHLVLTGGSPLKQQDILVEFIKAFIAKYGFKPFIEVENECVLMPSSELTTFVDCWNNSPKLANSQMKVRARYKEEVIKATAVLPNSWFKFVIDDEFDWYQIHDLFLRPKLIKKEQIILMPCGQTQAELALTRPFVADLAAENAVRFSDRLHVTIWDKKTGV